MQNATNEQKLEEATHWSALCAESLDRDAGDIELRAQFRKAQCALDAHAGRSDQAVKECRESLDLYRKLATPNHYEEARAAHMLGLLLGSDANYAGADEMYRQAERLFSETVGPNSSDTLGVVQSLAEDELEQDHLETALALEKRVASIRPDRSWLADAVQARAFYARLLVDAGRPAEALPYLLEAGGMLAHMQGAPPYLVAMHQRSFGAVYLALGKPAQALPYLQEAWKLMPAEGVDWERSLLAIDLARVSWEMTPQHARALEVARWSRDFMRNNGPLGPWRTRKLAGLEAWIQAHQGPR
jgi:tetratricopeptide (TPR) repeat protein